MADNSKIRIGDLMVTAGYITEDQKKLLPYRSSQAARE